jgi:hypothetical protein
MQVTLGQCFPNLMGETLRESPVFVSGINGSNRARMSKSQRSSLSSISRVCSLSIHFIRPNSQLSLLCGNTEAVT